MARNPKDIVKNITDLVSLPETCSEINRLVEDPQASAQDIAQAISRDPGLSARLLKIANSSYFGFPSRIDTISRAVAIIGTQELRDLVLATSIIGTLGGIDNKVTPLRDFWKHSLRCAIIARTLAAHCHCGNLERYFVAGLLHDVGNLVLYRELPELASETLHESRYSATPIERIERRVFGFDHAQLGAELMRAWQLPADLSEVTENHHDPVRSRNLPVATSLIHIADYLAHSHSGTAKREAPVELEIEALERSRLTPTTLQEIYAEANQHFDETFELMGYEQVA